MRKLKRSMKNDTVLLVGGRGQMRNAEKLVNSTIIMP